MQTEQENYMLAMQLAEAGVNYELNYASNGNTPPAHLYSAPYTGTVPGLTGSFTVYVENQDGTTNWTSGNPMTVVATGTVGNVARMISVNANSSGGPSIFTNTNGDSGGADGGFAVFGYSQVNFTTASSAINGDVGVNGAAEVTSNGNGSINGSCYLEGSTATESGLTVHNILHGTAPIAFPTVATVVSSTFANGYTTLTSAASIAAQSALLRTYSSNSPVNTPSGTKAIGWTNKTTLTTSDLASLNCNTIIFPPGDYYFTNININSSGYNIIFDTAAITTGGTPGPVHLWLANSTAADAIVCNVTFTKPNNCALFRLYYDKAATIQISGNQPFYGGFYGVHAGPNTSTSPATFQLGQNTKITGYVIGDNVLLTGGTVVTEVPTGWPLTYSTDFTFGGGSQYAFTGQWKELPINTAGAVFADGTNN
jgi:hypothetical protein